jgi:hypothetical protein
MTLENIIMPLKISQLLEDPRKLLEERYTVNLKAILSSCSSVTLLFFQVVTIFKDPNSKIPHASTSKVKLM